MLGRSKAKAMKEGVGSSADLAAALAQDPKFRRHLLRAAGHGAVARKRAASRIGLAAVAARLAADEELRRELREAAESLQQAWDRVQKKRSHKLRNTLLVAFGLGGIVAGVGVPQVRKWISGVLGKGAGGASGPRTIVETIEVGVPVSTAYNQWTQFEDFPLFMEGVEHVQQLDDTRLHWVAKVAGRQAEWDAKILEQHPDRQISWISEDGRTTRGTVTFEERGPSTTLVSLSMSYRAEGLAEKAGSAAGIDRRRVRGDLERFKELIEGRGAETAGWRGEVSAGQTEKQSTA
jgi:uncharacterized membrane protein